MNNEYNKKLVLFLSGKSICNNLSDKKNTPMHDIINKI